MAGAPAGLLAGTYGKGPGKWVCVEKLGLGGGGHLHLPAVAEQAAADVPVRPAALYPTEVVETETGGGRRLEKVYLLTADERGQVYFAPKEERK